jgi:hypothetical protein
MAFIYHIVMKVLIIIYYLYFLGDLQQANGFNTNRDSRGDNFASKCVMYQWDSVYLNLHANPLPLPNFICNQVLSLPKWWIPTCGKMSS